jgi:predicted DNA-binding WGR domain protein
MARACASTLRTPFISFGSSSKEPFREHEHAEQRANRELVVERGSRRYVERRGLEREQLPDALVLRDGLVT